MVSLVFLCYMHSAFDTLAKVFNPPEVGVGHRLAEKSQCVGGTTIQLIGRDQETPIIEVEGPLLTDGHVGFKVGGVNTHYSHMGFNNSSKFHENCNMDDYNFQIVGDPIFNIGQLWHLSVAKYVLIISFVLHLCLLLSV